jgi:hypothetical protein
MPHDDRLVITDPQVAKVLLNSKWVRLLKPFMAEPHSIKDVADKLQLDVSELYYPVRRFVKLGLLEPAFVHPRRGRSVTYYQSCSQTFVIPFHITSLTSFEEFVAQTETVWSQQLIQAQASAYNEIIGSEKLGLEMHYQDGYIWHAFVSTTTYEFYTDTELLGVIAKWDTNFYLNDQDVQRLSQEIAAVLGRYRQHATGPRRVVRFAVAPWKSTGASNDA